MFATTNGTRYNDRNLRRVLDTATERAGVPIRYPLARVARPDASTWAVRFHEFLLGTTARGAFRAAGFRVIGDG